MEASPSQKRLKIIKYGSILNKTREKHLDQNSTEASYDRSILKTEASQMNNIEVSQKS